MQIFGEDTIGNKNSEVMIKFFRQIRYNLMEQNKTGKYFKYAIGEIVLVVIGILIALQINNWNEIRKGGIEETKILKSLLEDFRETQTNLESSLESYSNYSKRLETQVNYFGYDKEFLTQGMKDTLLVTFYINTKIVQERLNGLLSSENFQLISNDELKKLLTTYPSKIEFFKVIELDAKNVVILEHRPIQARYISYTDLIKDNQEKYPNLEERAMKSDYEGLLRDRDFQNVIVNGIDHFDYMKTAAEKLLIQTKNITELIKEELITKG